MTTAKPWIRLYTDVPSNGKVQRLPPPLFKFWINCLCLYGKRGSMPTIQDISWRLQMPEKSVREKLAMLVQADLFTDENGEFCPHDWDDLQFESDTSRERQKKYRDRHKKRPRDVTVTAQEHIQNRADTETEQIQSKGKPVMTPALDEQFQEFARLYGEIGSPIEEDFMNGSWTWRAWLNLDYQQKCLVVQSLRDRIEAGQVVLHKPENYLKDGAFRRKIHQQRKSGSGNTAAELAAL